MAGNATRSFSEEVEWLPLPAGWAWPDQEDWGDREAAEGRSVAGSGRNRAGFDARKFPGRRELRLFRRLCVCEPGTYDVTCEASGFKTGASNGLVLQVDHTLRQDFKLAIGRASQTVTVSGQVQMLQTDNASIGAVVTSYFMQALPINGRDFTNLIVFNAGVTQVPGGGWIWASQSFANSVSGALTNAQKTTYMQCCSTNELVPRDMRDFAPRIGLAWRPTSAS